MNMIKPLLAAALGLLVPAAQAETEPTPAMEAAQPATTATSEITANVKGMVCDFCARAVTKVFGKHPSVAGVHVDLDNGEIHVSLNPNMDLSDEEVETLVKKSGYALISVEREAA